MDITDNVALEMEDKLEVGIKEIVLEILEDAMKHSDENSEVNIEEIGLEIIEESLKSSEENPLEDDFALETLEVLCTEISDDHEQSDDNKDKGEVASDEQKNISWYDLFRVSYYSRGRDDSSLPNEEDMTKKMVDAAGSEDRLSETEDIFKASSKFGDTSGDDANPNIISDAERDNNHDNQNISGDTKVEEATSEDPLKGKSGEIACTEVFETDVLEGFLTPSCLFSLFCREKTIPNLLTLKLLQMKSLSVMMREKKAHS